MHGSALGILTGRNIRVSLEYSFQHTMICDKLILILNIIYSVVCDSMKIVDKLNRLMERISLRACELRSVCVRETACGLTAGAGLWWLGLAIDSKWAFAECMLR